MPVIYVTAVEIKSLKGKEAGANGPYPPLNAAVYKYPRRNDRRGRTARMGLVESGDVSSTRVEE